MDLTDKIMELSQSLGHREVTPLILEVISKYYDNIRLRDTFCNQYQKVVGGFCYDCCKQFCLEYAFEQVKEQIKSKINDDKQVLLNNTNTQVNKINLFESVEKPYKEQICEVERL